LRPTNTLWFFAYVAGVKSPPSLKAARGIAVHRAAETNFTQKIDSEHDLPVNDLLDAFSTSYDSEIADGFRQDDNDPGEIKDDGAKLVRLFRREVAPRIQPEIVEQSLQYEINGQIWTGQIDVAQRVPVFNKATGEVTYQLEVRDLKTTGRTPQPDQYKLAMTGYGLSQRQATGEVEAGIVLDYLIALKNPRYEEHRSGPLSDEDIRSFAWIVEQVAAQIQAGRFVPNGLLSGACNWCGYRDICPARRGMNGGTK
jgi:PD-(D/E)XK nuclease superfamily